MRPGFVSTSFQIAFELWSSYIAVPSSLDQGQGMICMIGSAKSWSCASKNSIMEFLLVQHKATLSKGKGGEP